MKTEYTERYKLFLLSGGGRNYEYMAFIGKMKRLYLESINDKGDIIRNHDEFTAFIEEQVKQGLHSAAP